MITTLSRVTHKTKILNLQMGKCYMFIVRLALFSLCLCLGSITQANTLQEKTSKALHTPSFITKTPVHNSSFIGKALVKQKHLSHPTQTSLEDIKLTHTMYAQPSQSILAAQHEQFSRFLQTFFFTRES